MSTVTDRDVAEGYLALDRLLGHPAVNAPVTEAVALLALELERLRERVTALEAALAARGDAGEGDADGRP